MGSPSRNVQYHPPRLSEDRLNLPQPHSPSLPYTLLREIGNAPVADETLEMIELSVGHEDCCERSIAVLTDVQQLYSGPLARQALEGQLDVSEALELDAQSQLVHAGRLLSISSCVSLQS